jgi:hypothetical protein
MSLITKLEPIDLGLEPNTGLPLFVCCLGFSGEADIEGVFGKLVFRYCVYRVYPNGTKEQIKSGGVSRDYTNENKRLDIDLQTGQLIPESEIGVVDFWIKTVGQVILPDLQVTLGAVRNGEDFNRTFGI